MTKIQGRPTWPSDEIIEDSYPLSPMQQGMLFNTLYAEHPGVDIEQMVFTMHEELQPSPFERAWQRVVERHTILRTAFRWEGVPDPLQEVHRQVDFRMEQQDWRHLDRDGQKSKLENYLKADRRRGFNMNETPLLRGALFRLGEAEYQFVWTFSHALLDGRSFPILLREVFAFYEAFARNQELELDLPRPFREHIQWLKRQDPSRSKDFWRGMLKGFTAPTPFGVDRPRRDWIAEENAHGVQGRRLTPEQTSALTALAEKHDLTLNTLVQGAWALLLSRYSGDEDVVFGVTRACRSSALDGADSMVGLFINTLPMRARIESQMKLIQWLKALRAQQVAIREHEHTPLVTVQGWGDVPRGIALFDSILVFENYDLNSTLQAQGGRWLNREFHLIEQTNFPLTVAAYSDRELRLLISYDRQRFDDAAITRMLGHIEVLLNGMAANPEQRLSELPILTEVERHQLLVEWNNTDADYPNDTSIHHLFEAQVALTPDAAAVVFEDQQLSYHELNSRANQIAYHLQALGVGPEVRVGICVERSIEMIIGLLGILKAGGAYVPLDPAYPQERLAFMLEDTQAPVLLTQQRLATGLPEHGAKVVYLDTDSPIAQESEANPIGGVMPENLAYVIYTSGSTGQPKGVGIEHRQLVNYINGILERINLPGGASFASVSTIAADLGNTVIFSALCTGGCLHLISQERASNPSAMADYFGNHVVDCLKIVPSHLAALQTTLHPEQVLPRKLLILGGEASRFDWVERLRALAPDCTILNHYGPTEATIGVLTYRVEEDRDARGVSTLPLGRPIANSKIYLLDRHMQPVPIGVMGELYIGGVGLARGYLGRPALTAEKFIPNPFSDDPGARLYRTGDLARYLPDGNVEFLGRLDRQVKIRGFRIEPGEIEARLSQHPDVKEVTVQVREDPYGSKQLIAYVVPNPNRSPRIAGERRYRLPNNMAVAQLNKNETDYMYREIFETQAYLKHGITINDGDCVFDVGANIGLFMLFVDQICNNARIYSFEPNPVVYEKLSANASLYGSGVKLFNCGLSSETKTATFTFFPGFSLLSGFYADAEAEREVVKTFMNNQQRTGVADLAPLIEQADEIVDERFSPSSFMAQLVTLSSVMEQEGVEQIDLLKINAEKSELDVLTGIKDQDWTKIKQIVLEVDTKQNLDTILSLLGSHGYELIVEQDPLLENTQLCYVYAMRPIGGLKPRRENVEGTHLRHIPVLSEPWLSTSELKAFLSEKVPEYMVPSAFVFLDALPLTSNGKLDRRALPAPETSRPELSATFVSPQSEMEKKIAAIWQQVLHLDKVGVLDNFFDLGGHSLLVIQVQSKLREVVSRDLAIADLFRYPTIQTLANYLSNEQEGRAPLQKVVDRAKNRQAALDRRAQLRQESRQIQ